MSKRPKFEKPDVSMIKNEKFKVKTSQIPPMDVAFSQITLTDYELLVATIRKLNELVAMTNSYTELIEKILDWVVGDGVELAVKDKLEEWLEDGTLEELINDTLFQSKLDKDIYYDFVENVYNVFVAATTADLLDLNSNKLDKDIFEDFIDLYEDFKLSTNNKIGVIEEDIVVIENDITEIKTVTENPLKQRDIIMTDFYPEVTPADSVYMVVNNRNNLLRFYTSTTDGSSFGGYLPHCYEEGTITATTGQNGHTDPPNRIRIKEYLKLGEKDFYFNFNNLEYSVNIFFYDSEKNFISSTGWSKYCGLYEVPNNSFFIRLVFNIGYDVNNNKRISVEDMYLIKPELWV